MSQFKLIDPDMMEERLTKANLFGMPILLATGCFDVLHRGHVEMLEGARAKFPGHAVWVGLNGDSSVRTLKGEGRPLHDYRSRAIVIAALECVDYVFEVPGVRVTDMLRFIRPRVWVKGGDYTLETLDASEREAAQAFGTIIHLMPTIGNYSTTSILAKL